MRSSRWRSFSVDSEMPIRLVGEGAHRDHPSLAFGAEAILGRHAHVIEEDLVEAHLSGKIGDRLHFDARRIHRHQQASDPAVFPHFLRRSHHHVDPLRRVGEGGPDLLTVDHVFVALEFRPTGQGGEVAADIGFRVAGTPGRPALEQVGQEAFLLGIGSVGRSAPARPR